MDTAPSGDSLDGGNFSNNLKFTTLQFSLLSELLSYLCQGFTWFIGTGMGYQAIVKVFPRFAIFLEIDEHSGLLALIIHHKLHTFHRLAILTLVSPTLAKPYSCTKRRLCLPTFRGDRAI
jgi:hypothetical protein